MNHDRRQQQHQPDSRYVGPYEHEKQLERNCLTVLLRRTLLGK
jgi:hypothetical protein